MKQDNADAKAPLVWIAAGEASGDVLGARLMTALRKQLPDVRFAGIGGAHMSALGLASLFPMKDLAVMGLVEILPRLRSLSRRLDMAVCDVQEKMPDVVVTIDSPGFMLRLLRRISGTGIPRIHYVAPQVWAWREHRVKKFPGLWEKLLVLLPFEKKFFAKHGLNSSFVGHPVLQSGADKGDAERFRKRYGITPEQKILILMPGSRKSEIPKLLPVFGKMLHLLQENIPSIVPVLPVSPVVAEKVLEQTRDWPIQPLLIRDVEDKHDAFKAADVALTKSGTSTLELALAGVPMAVTYRVNPVTAAIARRLIRVRWVAMVNILADRMLVPELLQEDCRPDRLAALTERLITDPVAANAQRTGFSEIMKQLEAPDQQEPAEAAATEIVQLLKKIR
ncbi:MAG: lipid-A-disaccharide synthase [Acetobacter sp.]|jgi:lipid-A-disaccharide synthase|nr:lipid-A-disaccharide synthase [Acetobacter sp.]MCH4061154.1 lipid-A-disaccharide synthase [Acetobacter sp.]MCH4088092.1 lipid-A-disaccharide synthase [Acetobacter sp.]MCI1293294.1 lipid-A-disaccharide synthase [Acetobacter sp.]MCI1320081.1 lipid-A-disaccharide synthase [Acetobacter sp.]